MADWRHREAQPTATDLRAQAGRVRRVRPVLILTRDSAIAVLNSATVAPITSTIRSIPQEDAWAEFPRFSPSPYLP
jgi:mRNA-degrading endonuclease toxin of MazEF toxin-antitoxin module